ncbi:hypothetical protein TNCV_760231 [Trichonephila clavipes]|nr:hypothetical protein TNCV_760231 [Trichonephila clavipes]
MLIKRRIRASTPEGNWSSNHNGSQTLAENMVANASEHGTWYEWTHEISVTYEHPPHRYGEVTMSHHMVRIDKSSGAHLWGRNWALKITCSDRYTPIWCDNKNRYVFPDNFPGLQW